MFAGRLDLAQRYAADLATTGVRHGLVGPREVPRLWGRHLVNSALVSVLVPRGATVVDVGSGAGLPGVVLALVRPDLRVTLVEPLARRVDHLERVVAELGLSGVDVLRGRVDGRGPVVVDAAGTETPAGPFDVVTGRAVAGLDRLLDWLLPLTRPGGVVLAFKGRAADEELASVADRLDACGASGNLVELGPAGNDAVRVVRIRTARGPGRLGTVGEAGHDAPDGRSGGRGRRTGRRSGQLGRGQRGPGGDRR